MCDTKIYIYACKTQIICVLDQVLLEQKTANSKQNFRGIKHTQKIKPNIRQT